MSGNGSKQCCNNYATPANNRRQEALCFPDRPSVRPSVNTYLVRRDLSLLGESILMKHGTNIHHVTWRW